MVRQASARQLIVIPLALAVVAAAGAASEQRVQPVGLPISIVLPDDWSGHSFGVGPLAYQAFGPNLSTEFDVQRNTPAPTPKSFEQEFTTKIRRIVLGQDAHATFDTGMVKLPAGRAVEVVAHVRVAFNGPPKPATVWVYGIERGPAYYTFTCYGRPNSKTSAATVMTIMRSLSFS
jgi:hypothetical protein